MRKKYAICSFVTLLIVATLACGTMAYPTSTPEAKTEPAKPTKTPVPTVVNNCAENERSNIAVLRSADHGITWSPLGKICYHDPMMQAADPTPLLIDDTIVLYFLDLRTLGAPNQPKIIYRTTSVDGMNFTTPQPAYSDASPIVDPFVLRMPDGSFRMYFPSDYPAGINSAVSRDGITFAHEDGVRTLGGMPGALLLPDNRVRLFVAGNGNGISSLISNDGLHFTEESGMRIPGSADTIVDNPEPIHLADGTYLMLYQIRPKAKGTEPAADIHLATSVDGFNWIANPTVITVGGTSCVVEMKDGTLLIYYLTLGN